MPLTPGTVVGSDFRIVRPLAEGGMGAVYEAEQLSTGRRRALKTMHPSLASSASTRERFAQEARIGSVIPSDHVVEVIAAGIDGPTGVPWLAMEMLEGETLGDRIARSGSMSPAETLAVMEQLGHALGAAHGQSIVHRDLKPDNVFLAVARRSDVPFTVKVLDFGIAKWMQESQSTSANSQAMGTPLWMAPEQATPGAAIRPSTDVWAVGLIAFSMLTGTSYWKSASTPGGSVQSLVVEIMIEPIEPASMRCARLTPGRQLPAGFDEWFGRCVARNTTERFVDGAAAVGALRAVLGPGSTIASPQALAGVQQVATVQAAPWPSSPGFQPAATLPTPSPAPARASSSRGWIVAALAGGAIVLVIAGAVGGIGWTLSRRAHREKRDDGSNRPAPQALPSPITAKATFLAAGPLHACAVLQDKTLRCWGNNMLGQLGDGSVTERTTPIAVSGLDRVERVAVGSSYTCAVTSGGVVRCWGDNQVGQLGDGTTQRRSAPSLAIDVTGVESIGAGFWHTCATLTDRTVRCWGGNAFGGLGEAGTMQRPKAGAVPGLSNVTQVSVGVSLTCAAHVDGTVSCWGVRQRTPKLVAGLTDIQQISAGAQSACALSRSGAIRCWGENKEGQLGIGSTSPASAPTPVVGVSDAVRISVGASHACAVRKRGGVVCWGGNSVGQLGDGSTREQLAPVQVAGLEQVRDVAVGGNFTCALSGTGEILCWGGNENGQLGDGSHDSHGAPVRVKLDPD